MGVTVSMVQRCDQTETHPISFEEIWRVTRSGEHGLKEKINLIRNRYEAEKDITGSPDKAKKSIAKLKLQLPGFLPTGTFSKRENGALVEYSGLLCADMDTLGSRLAEIRQILKTLPFVHAVALSPSGDGLKVFFNVLPDPARHEDSFRSIQQNVRESLEIEIDQKCKDLARICFFTYDPDLWIREDGNEVLPPADPLPRSKTFAVDEKLHADATRRELIAVRLLGELRPAPEKGGYFCNCPGESFHTAKSAEKHTILYLETVPTLFCQHQSCAHVVESFNRVLRSEIGKSEYVRGVVFNGEKLAAPPPEEEEEPWVSVLRRSVVTTNELRGLFLEPRAKLLDEWFCEADLGMIFGPRGSAKTWFVLGITQALTTAGQFGEWKAENESKVLYVDGEMPPDMMRSRIEGLQAVNNNLFLLNHQILFDRATKTLNITLPHVQDAITELCLSLGIKVMILDNLSTLGVGMKENDADSWEKVNYWLLNLRRKKIAVIIVHHAGRSGEMRGTSRREDNVFWIIVLDDSKKDAETVRGVRFVSRFTKDSRNTQNKIPVYDWHLVTESEDLVSVSCVQGHTIDVFRAVIESGVTKPSEIARVMNIPDYQISRLAKKAFDAGWLERSSRGEYKLTDKDE
jgi:putative DNA primase/helicase